jgi:hypothetical protein
MKNVLKIGIQNVGYTVANFSYMWFGISIFFIISLLSYIKIT